MSEFISVHVIALEKLFSDAYIFRLPYFQRAYAWQTPQVGRLLTNIIDAMRAPAAEDRRYFLGTLMLARRNSAPVTALVDGHQRIMSLTILFSVLRDLETDPAVRSRLHERLAGPTGFRLEPQEHVAEFTHRYIQEPGGTKAELDDESELSETERNILTNRDYLAAQLSSAEVTPEFRRELCDFLCRACSVIVAAVESEDEAWRMLQIEEETRVDFNATDCAKASILDMVPVGERAACQSTWEEIEAQLGAADLFALLGHLRLLEMRKLSDRPVEVELAQRHNFNTPGRAGSFLSDVMKPAADTLSRIRQGKIGDRHRAEISELIARTGWISDQVWIPAALLWLSRERSEADTLLFFKRIERLVFFMKLANFDGAKQTRRIAQLVGEIDRGASVAQMRELEISGTLRGPALETLRLKKFDSKKTAPRLLRRISVSLGQDPGPIHAEKLTLEHILPKGSSQGPGWRKHFPNKDAVARHAHMLGNLTFLTSGENKLADTLEWSEKRRIFAASRIVLSNRLGATLEWTPQAINRRTEELIRVLFAGWDLKP